MSLESSAEVPDDKLSFRRAERASVLDFLGARFEEEEASGDCSLRASSLSNSMGMAPSTGMVRQDVNVGGFLLIFSGAKTEGMGESGG